jgi:hypothetical protein
MKGSSVRVRASALKDLQNAHFCFLSRRRLMCSNAAACDKRPFRALLADGGGRTPGRRGRQNTAEAALSDWCSRLALRSRPASEHGSAAIRSVAATAGDLWTSVRRSGVRHRDDEATAFGQEQSSGELQPTRLLLVHCERVPNLDRTPAPRRGSGSRKRGQLWVAAGARRAASARRPS